MQHPTAETYLVELMDSPESPSYPADNAFFALLPSMYFPSLPHLLISFFFPDLTLVSILLLSSFPVTISSSEGEVLVTPPLLGILADLPLYLHPLLFLFLL